VTSVIILLLLFCFGKSGSTIDFNSALAAPHADEPSTWIIDCVDCPKNFTDMSDRSLQLDNQGHPHIAYGADHLY
jgi:hypothetical protein